MKSIKIKGKDYIEVNERVKEFRTNPKYEGFTIGTEILENSGGEVIMRCTITSGAGFILSQGIAHEVQGSSMINKTSHIENCETSAVGRALGFLGIGIDTSIASHDEVDMAIKRQGNGQNLPPIHFDAESEPAGYVFTWGKHKGKNLSEVGKGDVKSYYTWIKSQDKFDRGGRNKNAYDCIESFIGIS